MKNILIAVIAVILLGLGGFAYYGYSSNQNNTDELVTPINYDNNAVSDVFSNLNNNNEQQVQEEPKEKIPEILSVLLLGIDRRSKAELGFRTDTMILAMANTRTNKVVLTSIPRDLWINGSRVNAALTLGGWENLQSAVQTISGQEVDKYVYTDFEDFSWIVDAMGGVDVNVERSFTDTLYPVDATKEYQTIQFTAGPEKLTGERALIYTRSRKGNNGEGSDWMRMQRQHLVLRGMIEAFKSPASIFKDMDPVEAFRLITTNRMTTNLNAEDVRFFWDFYKDRKDYEISSMYLDGEYLYNPPLSEYGGAWVLVPQGNDFSAFQTDLMNKLNGVEFINVPIEETTQQPESTENTVQ